MRILQENLSETTVHMMKCMAPSASHVVLRKGDEFWDHLRTQRELLEGRYFHGESADKHHKTSSTDEITHWPAILRAVIEGGQDGALALSALGGVMWHTRRALIDHDLLSMQRFAAYIPSDMKHSALILRSEADGDIGSSPAEVNIAGLSDASSLPGSSTDTANRSHMVLDGVSLSNLEILRNSSDGGEKGSLWGFMNRCSTAFGRRLLKDWLLKPLVMPR